MSIAVLGQSVIALLALYNLLGAFLRMNRPKIRYFALLALAVFLYAVGFMMELSTHSLEAAYIALRVQSYGCCFYAALLYLFIRDYINRPLQGPWQMGLLLLIPSAGLLLANAYPISRIFYADLRLDLASSRLVVEAGPLMLLQNLFNLTVIACCLVEILRNFTHDTREEQVKRWTFLLATALPVLSMLLFRWERVPLPVQAGSGSLVIAQLILGNFILRRCAQDWLPFARESVVEYMGDGYALVDNQMRLMDINEQTGQYFGAFDLPAGTPVTEIPGFPVSLLDGDGRSQETQEFALATPQGEIWLQASATPICHNGKLICTCVLFYDITDKRKRLAELEDLAIHDALTGLHNRGEFFRLARRDFDMHIRADQPASLLMVDIDFFKKINDTYGHQTGDVVLQQVSKLILSRLRSTDLAGRYGGEEFCIFLPSTDKAGAVFIAEEVRREVERLVIRVDGAEVCVTVSIGAASLVSAQHRSVTDLIADADAALYSAKRGGRNRVVTAAPVLLSPLRREKKAE